VHAGIYDVPMRSPFNYFTWARCASQLMALQLAASVCSWEGPEGDRLVSRPKLGFFTDGTIGVQLAELIFAPHDTKTMSDSAPRSAGWRMKWSRFPGEMRGLTPSMFLVQNAPAAHAKTKAMSVAGAWHCELQALYQTPVGKGQVIAHGDVTSNQDRIRWRARGGASDTDLPFPAA
jgi:hypothetical protein